MVTRKSVLLGLLVTGLVLIPVAAGVYFATVNGHILPDGSYEYSVKNLEDPAAQRGTAVFKAEAHGQSGALNPEGKGMAQVWMWDKSRKVYEVAEREQRIGTALVGRLNSDKKFPFTISDEKGTVLCEGSMKEVLTDKSSEKESHEKKPY